MTRSIVVSGPPAVGKTTVARALASEFGLECVGGGDVLKEMAVEHGLEPGGDDWWDTEAGMSFLAMREGDPAFDRRLDQRLAETYGRGGAVITSYTLPWLVDGGVKIWLGGSHESSTRRMQSRDEMGAEEAYAVTKKRYDRNRELYRKLYGFEFGRDLSVFDIVIGTDGLDAAGVIRAAAEGARRLL
ncbi:MAG: AAA family ATPase [Nitrosopumilus sp.]|nr:AAA family ATPase [Nitrosopumilus sp.]MDA7943481.1 AAA family ATPase [Nitrosopumilus sp.]MDA7953010.1 AAA family ATPase [Nitrosopumilus sp.]MDA7958607.1 AAA family ATPase [Nitrosopumilus sp.]MDA7960025.1 AAA family ATPase [Nitrosopumilus sp.]